MLYTEGEKTNPRAGELLARVVNPTTELDVLIEDAHVSGSGSPLARLVVVSGDTRATVRIISKESDPVRDGRIVVRLGGGDALEMVTAADVDGLAVGSFRCGQFDYPCAKPYGEEKLIHDFTGVPEHHREQLLSRIAMPDAVHRNHCELPVGHKGDCGPLKKGA